MAKIQLICEFCKLCPFLMINPLFFFRTTYFWLGRGRGVGDGDWWGGVESGSLGCGDVVVCVTVDVDVA